MKTDNWESEPPLKSSILVCLATCALTIELARQASKDCHDALAGHAADVWPRAEWSMPAVLCGTCGLEMSVRTYFDCGNICPGCGARFNPGCRTHYHFYFESGKAI